MQITLKANVLHIQQIWNVLQPGLLNMFMQIMSTNISQQTYKRAYLHFSWLFITGKWMQLSEWQSTLKTGHFERENLYIEITKQNACTYEKVHHFLFLCSYCDNSQYMQYLIKLAIYFHK